MTTLEPYPGEPLTEAERELMVLLCEGLTNAEIAARRGTSCGTTKAQVRSVLVKLAARNRTHAAALYTRRMTAKD